MIKGTGEGRMANEYVFVSFAAGIIAGIYFFYGLWLTVRKLPLVHRPKRLLGLSFIARVLPVLLALYLILRSDFILLFPFLAGFFAIRFLALGAINHCTKGAPHASQSR